MEADRTYFARRSTQEKAAAQNALDPVSEALHLELAFRYQCLADVNDDNSHGFAQPVGRFRVAAE